MRFEQRGQTMVIVALMMTAMIGMLGLSIDGGRLYVERRMLQNGSDAASLAMSDAYFGAVQKTAPTNPAPFTTTFNAGLAEFAKQVGESSDPAAWTAVGSIPTDCSISGTSSTYPPSAAPGGGNVVGYSKDGYTLLLSAWKSSSSAQPGICVFNASATFSIPTFFINVLSSTTSVSATSLASAVSAHIFTPPTLLVLDPTCGPPGPGNALVIGGGSTVTVNGTTRTDGNATVDNNTTVQSNGNFFDHCDNQTTVNGFGFQYGAGGAGFGNAGTETDPLLGFASSFPTFLAPYSSASPSDSEGSNNACNRTSLGCVEVEPGTFSTTNSFPSGGGCWFAEPGIYDWSNTGANALSFNGQGIVISNELTPPDGYNPSTLAPAPAAGSANSESPTFNWNLPNNGGTSQPCNGEVRAYSIPDTGLGAKQGKYYFRISSVRQESFTVPATGTSHSFWRESYLSSNQCPPGTNTTTFPGCTDVGQGLAGTVAAAGCLPVQVTGTLPSLGDQDVEIGISNVPGMGNPIQSDGHDSTVLTEYHVYASTTGCSSNLGFVTKAATSGGTFRQTIDKLTKVSSGANKRNGCPYLSATVPPAPNTSTGTPNDPLVTGVQCSLGYNGSSRMNSLNLGLLWSPTGTACDLSSLQSGCAPPYITAPTAGTYGTTGYFAPDAANEDECINYVNDTRCNPNPFPNANGVTPGGAMFYFPNTTNCISQTQSAPYIFGGLQWDGVVLYTQPLAGQNELDPSAPVDCGNGAGINGSEGGQFIGIVYVPDASLTVQGTGSPIDGALVVWQLVLGAGSNTILTGRFPHVQEITAGHLIDCTNGGVSITTYCAAP